MRLSIVIPVRNERSTVIPLIERVRAVRGSRSEQAWRDTLTAVEQAARDGSNLVTPIVAAVEAHATLGEIADALRGVFGEYQGSSGA